MVEAIEQRGTDDGAAEAALAAAARHDVRAFAPLYERYAARVYRYCYLRLGHRQEAEDATSLTFVRALAALPGYRGGSFAGWLFAIAHNVTVNSARRPPEQPLDTAFHLADGAASPEDRLLAAETVRRLRALLLRLSDDQRRVLELRLAGLTGPEIAAALGRSVGAVRVLQFRALARLRALPETADLCEGDHRGR